MKKRLSDTFSLHRALPAVLILTALALLIYVNIFNAPFVFDDTIRISENPVIRLTEVRTKDLLRIFKSPGLRPTADLSFGFNYLLHGYNVRGYHIVNVIIHIFTALLVFGVSRQTLRLCHFENKLIPLFAAALWLANPVHTQSVTYIVQRMNSLAAMFFMLALFCYIKGRLLQQTTGKQLPVFFCFTCCCLAGLFGLASKQIAAVLPIMLLLYEWSFFQNLDKTWLKRQLPWAGIIVLVMMVLIFFNLGFNPLEKLRKMYEPHPFSLEQRLLTQPLVVIYYISLLFFPHPARLNLIYDFPLSNSMADPITTALAAGALLAVLTAAIYGARRHRLFWFAVLWFMIALIIESSFIPLALVYEHRTYLPSIFPVIGLTVLVFHHVRPKALAVSLLCAAVGISSLWAYQRNNVWQTDLALWQDTLSKSPDEPLCASGVASSYKNIKKYDLAVMFYEKALAKSTHRGNKPHIPLNNIGEILLQQGRPRQAETFLNKALSFCPEYDKAHTNLGAALLRQGRIDEAIKRSQRALKINPQIEAAYNNLGNAWFLKGDVKQAVDNFKQALLINPDYREALGNLAKVQNTIKKYGGYIDQLKTSARQQPDDPQPAYQLARLSLAAGMTEQAVFWYKKALAIEPTQTMYLNALSTALIALGRISDAADVMEQLALQIPDNPTVFYNLACLYARQNKTDRALTTLKTAVDKGYNRWDHLRTDKDLESIRKTPYVQRLTGESPHLDLKTNHSQSLESP